MRLSRYDKTLFTKISHFQKAGLVWTGEDGGEDTEVAGGQSSMRGLGGLQQWMGLMAEHMAQDSARLPFLWPKLSTGNQATVTNKQQQSLTNIIKYTSIYTYVLWEINKTRNIKQMHHL